MFSAVLVDPLPGVETRHLRDVLNAVATEAINLRGTGAFDIHRQYIDWANRGADRLGRVVSTADLDRLVLTRQHWVLQEMIAESETIQARQIVTREVAERVRALEEAVQELDRQVAHWAQAGTLVVPDTSFYIQNPVKLEQVELWQQLNLPPFEPIRIVVPMVVVDELDGLKTSNNRHVSWRAVYTLAVLDDRLRDPTKPGTLRPEDKAQGWGEVSVEVLFDRPAHTRLPIPDDEIVDRAVALQGLAGRPVTVITCDTGQSWRARAAKLRAIKVPRESGPQPTT